MTDINAANGASANTSPHASNANQHDPGQQPTTPSTPRFEWTSAKDGVLVALMAANSSRGTHYPRWTQFAMACKNFGLGVPYHLSDDDLLNRCHELKSTLEEWDLVVNARKRPKDENGYLAYSKGYRNEDSTAQVEEGSRSAAQAAEQINGTREDAANQGEAASALNHEGTHHAHEAEVAGSSSNVTSQKRLEKQRKSTRKKFEAKKRAHKRQSNIVIQGKFDFFNVKKTTRGSKKTVSFRGEGTVNVPF